MGARYDTADSGDDFELCRQVLLVHHTDHIVLHTDIIPWDREVMLTALMAWLEIGFSRILFAQILEKAFHGITTLPFPCLIFHICRVASVPLWNYDRLTESAKIVNVGFIKDDANQVAPKKGIQIDLPHLGDDLLLLLMSNSLGLTGQMMRLFLPLVRISMCRLPLPLHPVMLQAHLVLLHL